MEMESDLVSQERSHFIYHHAPTSTGMNNVQYQAVAEP